MHTNYMLVFMVCSMPGTNAPLPLVPLEEVNVVATSPSKDNGSGLLIGIIAAVLVLAAGGTGLGYWWYKKPKGGGGGTTGCDAGDVAGGIQCSHIGAGQVENHTARMTSYEEVIDATALVNVTPPDLPLVV